MKCPSCGESIVLPYEPPQLTQDISVRGDDNTPEMQQELVKKIQAELLKQAKRSRRPKEED